MEESTLNRISNDLILQIKNQSDIIETISNYVSLKKRGNNFIGLCPFHSEKTPSFTVNPEKQIFHCFGCGAGGDIYKFLMQSENITFFESVENLSKKTGIKLPEKSEGVARQNTEHDRLFAINKTVSDFYHQVLIESAEAKAAREFLKKRGIDLETIKKFSLGFALPQGSGLYVFLKKKNIPLELAKKNGLIRIREGSQNYYDTFRQRIIIPIFDYKNRITGFGARTIIESNKDIPKYINSSESIIYKKREILYGLNFAKNEIRKKNFVLVVEGYFDFITTFQAGIENVVATSGTALTTEQCKLIKRFTENVTIVFDSDMAGNLGMERGYNVLLEQGLKVKTAPLPPPDDPDSFIKRNGGTEFASIINSAKPFCEYIINYLIDSNSSSDKLIGNITRILLLISKTQSNIERDYYLNILSDKTKISKEALNQDLKKISLYKTKEPVRKEILKEVQDRVKKSSVAGLNAEKFILQLMLHDINNIFKLRGNLNFEDFESKEIGNIIKKIFDISDENRNISLAMLLNQITDEKNREIITKLAVEEIDADNSDKIIYDCLKVINKKKFQKEFDEIKRQRKDLLSQGTSKEEYQNLEKRFLEIKKNF